MIKENKKPKKRIYKSLDWVKQRNENVKKTWAEGKYANRKKPTEEQKTKISIALKKNGHKPPSWLGKKHSKETIEKLKKCKKGFKPITAGLCGELNPNWKGGRTHWRMKLLKSEEYINWKKSVLKKDNLSCTECNVKYIRLDVHHIIPLSILLDKYNINSYEQAVECKELWNMNNGQTLCWDCHKKTNSYGSKLYNKYKKEFLNKPEIML